jgi:hypothetical protein
MVNPAPEDNLRSAMLSGRILFGTNPVSLWEALLGLALLRVVRQANYVSFWALVELVTRWRGHGLVCIEIEDAPGSAYEKCTKYGQHHL